MLEGIDSLETPEGIDELAQLVRREELRTSLLGYYENPGFKEATPEDALDMDSLFIETADSPVEGVSGTVLVLNVKARQDMSSSLPIWSMYQTYYFAKEGNAWNLKPEGGSRPVVHATSSSPTRCGASAVPRLPGGK